MESTEVRESDGNGRAWPTLAKLTGLALGVGLFGMVGLSGTLAQDDDATAGTVDADALVESIIADIFAGIFGGGAGDDDAAVPGGDMNVGGNTGGNVTMGGSMGGGITIGGSSGGSGVTVGDESGG
jgi:hypothetical protein